MIISVSSYSLSMYILNHKKTVLHNRKIVESFSRLFSAFDYRVNSISALLEYFVLDSLASNLNFSVVRYFLHCSK